MVSAVAAASGQPAATGFGPEPGELSLVRPLAAVDAMPPTGMMPASVGAESPSRRPLMSLMDQVGLGRPLDDARIDLYGHVEAGYTRNFKHPPNVGAVQYLCGEILPRIDRDTLRKHPVYIVGNAPNEGDDFVVRGLVHYYCVRSLPIIPVELLLLRGIILYLPETEATRRFPLRTYLSDASLDYPGQRDFLCFAISSRVS